MNLGNMISSLRKRNNLSQEELAEKVGVTRQTISKWELEETAPDIKQALVLSKVFNVSLDELTNNDVSNILVDKVSNTERLAGITIKLLKIMGIGILFFIVVMSTLFIFFNLLPRKDRKITGSVSITCKLNDDEYLWNAEHNQNFQIINAGGDAWITNHIDLEKYDDVNQVIAHIEDYFKEHGGSCNTN